MIPMDAFQPFAVSQHDREEFWRDAEAATRIGNRDAAALFLAHLCRRRAQHEVIEVEGHVRADQSHLVREREATLFNECYQLGYHVSRITGVVALCTYSFETPES